VKKLFPIPFIIVLVSALILGGCAKPVPPAPEEIRIGACESATGAYSGFATGGIFGMRAAVADINKLGGVYVEEYGRKLPVKLIVVDNESDPAKAGTLAEDLILRDKVHLLVNSPGPATLFNPQAAVSTRHKIPYLAGFGPVEPWQGARQEASPPWEYTWGFGFAIAKPPPPDDFRYGKPGYTIMDTWFEFMDMFGDQTNKKVAVFASDDADGRGWYATFPGELEKRGYDVVGEERMLGMSPIGTTDFSAMIKEWKDNNCEVMWGNHTPPDFGTMWRQCHTMGYRPKMCLVAKAPLFFEDVSAWGGELPQGVAVERWWDPAYPADVCPGIGDRTAKMLFEEWGKPLNQGIGWGYVPMQILFDAIERAGTLDGDAVNKAIGETDMMTISHRAVFTEEEHHCRLPLTFGQWMKVDKPWVWECPIVLSVHDWVKATDKPVFPLPTK